MTGGGQPTQQSNQGGGGGGLGSLMGMLGGGGSKPQQHQQQQSSGGGLSSTLMGLMGSKPQSNSAPPPTSGPIRPNSSGSVSDEAEFAQQAATAIAGDVKMFSGCQDHQTSADVQDISKFGLPDANGAGGACTNAILLTLQRSPQPTWFEMLSGMRSVLKTKRFSQVPQLSSSRKLSMNQRFSVMNENSNGRTKALMIGINYVGQQGELSGCHNDVKGMVEYLKSSGYSDTNETMKLLMDDALHESPTASNIMGGFKWLLAGAQPGDSLFFHYSGHGGSMPDDNGDEADGKDETMVPLDYQRAGQIRDDLIFTELVVGVPKGVTLTVVMDCCHSGSILDLPYMFKADSATMDAVAGGQAVPEMSGNPQVHHSFSCFDCQPSLS
ncbi:unnamed protein product [Chrysoparadoxa australica]